MVAVSEQARAVWLGSRRQQGQEDVEVVGAQLRGQIDETLAGDGCAEDGRLCHVFGPFGEQKERSLDGMTMFFLGHVFVDGEGRPC